MSFDGTVNELIYSTELYLLVAADFHFIENSNMKYDMLIMLKFHLFRKLYFMQVVQFSWQRMHDVYFAYYLLYIYA